MSSQHRVVAVHRGRVVLDDGRLVPVRGRVLDPPLVGDCVELDGEAVGAIAPRRTVIEGRVANADVALIVSSLNRDLNLRRIERLLALTRGGGLEPAVVLTKADLADDPLAAAEQVAQIAGGAPVLVVSALAGTGLAGLHALLAPGRTAVMLGTSGTGKSTLANVLLGEERMRTHEIRAGDDRGRHTTTHRELLALPNGAFLVDTPGVRLVRLAGSAGLEATFDDLQELTARCRFRDCRHETEPGCAVRAAIEQGELDPKRLAAARKLEREAARADKVAARARERANGRLYRQIPNRPR